MIINDWGDFMRRIERLDKIVVRYILLIAVLALAVFNYELIIQWVGKIWRVLMPILVGGVIAFILNIPMYHYEKLFFPQSNSKYVKALRRPVAIFLSLLTITIVILLVTGLVLPQIYNVITEALAAVPLLGERLQEGINHLQNVLPEESSEYSRLFQINWNEAISNIRNWANTLVGGILNTTLSTVGSLASFVINGVLSLIFSFYLLMSKEHLLDQFLRLLTTYTSKAMTRRILYVLTTLDDAFKHFLTAEVIDATILGTLVTLGMWLFRFPYPGMIGALTGVLALIPMLGAYLSGAIGMVLISAHSIPQALWFLVFMICVQQFEGNVIYPRIVGNSLGLPGMWVLFAVTVGGGLFGIPGMLIGVPLASAVYKIVRRDILEREQHDYKNRRALIQNARKDSFKQISDDLDQAQIEGQSTLDWISGRTQT